MTLVSPNTKIGNSKIDKVELVKASFDVPPDTDKEELELFMSMLKKNEI